MKIVETLRERDRCNEECQRAAEILQTALGDFGMPGGERNPPHRLRAFTEALVQELRPQETSAPQRRSPSPQLTDQFEQGKIIWFDGAKNFGFIARDNGGDLFVHESQIRAIPWHLRIPGSVVHYKVVNNPRSRGMIMASEVGLYES